MPVAEALAATRRRIASEPKSHRVCKAESTNLCSEEYAALPLPSYFGFLAELIARRSDSMIIRVIP